MGVLTDEEYRIIAQNYLKTTEFNIVEAEEKELKGSYESFSGLTIRLSITVTHKEKGQLINLSLFLKKYPTDGGFYENFIKSIRIFYKETHLYNRLLNKLNDNIKGRIFAKCFYTRPDEVLVLEDLMEAGFKKKELYETLSSSECEMALCALAKLHSASIIYEDRHEIKLNQELPDVLFEPLFVSDPGHPGFHHLCVGINSTESVIEAYFSHVDPTVCQKLYDLMKSIPERMKPSRKYRNVLNHGNPWVNNVMFSYDYEGKVDEARIVDFKLARYCPPSFDVLLFLHLTTSHALRETDTESLLIHYYNKLGRELAEADIDVHAVMSWEEFKSSVQEVLPLVLAITAFYIQFYFIPHDRLLSIMKSPGKYEAFIKEDRSQLVLDVMRTEEHYRKRVTQAVHELTDFFKKQKQ